MQNKTTGYEALTAVYQPDAVFVEHNSKDYSLTQEILSRLSHVPVYEIKDIGQLEKDFKVSRSDVFGEGKKNLVLSRFNGSFLKKCPHLLSFKTISSGSKSARVIAQITSLVDKSENLSSSVMFII